MTRGGSAVDDVARQAGSVQLVVDPDELGPHRQADAHLVRRDAGQLADHPHALGQLHERDHDRQPLTRHRRVVVHDVAVDLPGSGRDDVPGGLLPAGRARGPGGWRTRPAVVAALDAQFACGVPAQKNSVSGETTGRMT